MPTVAKSFEAHGPFIHKTEKDHFQLLLCGGFDETYAQSCQDICRVEYEIGLSARTRMIAGALIIEAVLEALSKRFRSSPAHRGSWCAGDAGNHFDLAITQTLDQDAFAKANAARHQNIDAAIGGFEQQIGALLGDLKGASDSLFAQSEAMRAGAQETTSRTKIAAAASADGTQCRPDYRCDGRTGKIDRRDRAPGAERLDAWPAAQCSRRRRPTSRFRVWPRRREDRRRGEADQRDRGADQLAGAECDDRGGARGRRGQGLRGGGVGGEEPGDADGAATEDISQQIAARRPPSARPARSRASSSA